MSKYQPVTAVGEKRPRKPRKRPGRPATPARPANPSPRTAPASRRGLQVALTSLTRPPRPPLAGWLEPMLVRAAAAAGARHGAIALAIVDDSLMKTLHRQHLNKPTTTDVLTFDLRDSPRRTAALDAQIVICLDVARRQARARETPLRHEVLLYAVHGLLHLLGYDDHNPRAASAMHAREDQLLTRLGIDPVYHRPVLPAGVTRP